MTLTSTFSGALDLAYLWHREQERKGRETPYLAHLMSVASLLLEAGGDEEMTIAGLLHDAIEDAPDLAAARRRQELIRREFGPRVDETVRGCTDGDPEEKERLGWRERKERYVEHLRNEASGETVAVSLCDKLHNARAVLRDLRRAGDDLWERFNATRDETLWYYRAVAEAFHARTESLAAVLPNYRDPLDELDRVVAEIEERARSQRAPARELRLSGGADELRVIAVDWSGAKRDGGRKKIWLAEVVDGTLRRLENGRSRPEVIQHLVETAQETPRLVVGFDFVFSFPAWFLDEQGIETGRDAWELVAKRGERWLDGCEYPFWGRPGRGRPDLSAHFRRTERRARSVAGAQPKSVFQIGGAGAVGTGSLRGMPHLARLSDAGFSVWPFETVGWPLVLEIYPRLLTGELVKSDSRARSEYLEDELPEIPDELRNVAAGSADALDAAVSAVVMSRHVQEVADLGSASDDVARREGRIWWPADEPAGV